jgi:hypothetical protein
MGHDIFRLVWEVTEMTNPYPTNQKSACLFLSKHVLTCGPRFDSSMAVNSTWLLWINPIANSISSKPLLECCSNPGFPKALSYLKQIYYQKTAPNHWCSWIRLQQIRLFFEDVEDESYFAWQGNPSRQFDATIKTTPWQMCKIWEYSTLGLRNAQLPPGTNHQLVYWKLNVLNGIFSPI